MDTIQSPGDTAQIPPEAKRFCSIYREWLTTAAEPQITVRSLTITDDNEVHLIHELPHESNLRGRGGETFGGQLLSIVGGYCGIPEWEDNNAWKPARLQARGVTPDGSPLIEWQLPSEWARRYQTGEWDKDDLLEATLEADTIYHDYEE